MFSCHMERFGIAVTNGNNGLNARALQTRICAGHLGKLCRTDKVGAEVVNIEAKPGAVGPIRYWRRTCPGEAAVKMA